MVQVTGVENTPTPTTKNVVAESESYTEAPEVQSVPTIRGCQNSSQLNSVYPLVIGKSYFTPKYIGQPYTTVSGTLGNKITYHAMYMLGYNDIEVTDFCLGMKKIASNSAKVINGNIDCSDNELTTSNVHLEIRKTGECNGYSEKVVQEDLNAELLHPHGTDGLTYQMVGATFGYKTEIEIQLDGLFKRGSNGSDVAQSVGVLLEFSNDGGLTYHKWGSNPFVSNDSSLTTSYDSATGVCALSGKVYKVMRLVATKTLSYADVKDIPTHAIEFRIKRVTESSDTEDETDKITVNAIRTWCYDPEKSESANRIVHQAPMIASKRDITTRVSFDITLENNISIQDLKEFNCIVQAKGRTWNGTTWSSQKTATCNPASMALEILQNQCRGDEAYADSEINLDSFGAFYEWCENNIYHIKDEYGTEIGFTANGVITKAEKTSDLLSQILSTGRGFRTDSHNKIGVEIDKAQTESCMLLNNQNVLEASNSREFVDDISGYEVQFNNRMKSNMQDTMYCLYEGKSTTDEDFKTEKVIAPFQTVIDQIQKNCYLALKKRVIQREVWARKVTQDGNLAQVGKLIDVQDDTILLGIGDGAEITELVYDDEDNPTSIIGIKTDGNFYVDDEEKTYGVRIEETNGDGITVITEYVTITSTGEKSDFTFTTPISLSRSHKPMVEDIISFGEMGKITYQGIVEEKKENGDGTFELSILPYDESIYSADMTIPVFQSKITVPIPYQRKNQVTQEDLLNTKESVANIIDGTGTGNPTPPTNLQAVAKKDVIAIKCNYSQNTITGKSTNFQYKIIKGDEAEVVITTSSTDGEYVINRETDGYPESSFFADWTVQARVQNIYGNWSEWTDEVTINTDEYGTWIIPALRTDNVSKEEIDRTVVLKLTTDSASKELYGNTQFRISIKLTGFEKANPTDPDSDYSDVTFTPDTNWYKPNLYDSPYGSEFNYKYNIIDGYETVTNRFSQTLPLVGQDSRKIVNTVYSYQIVATNESGYTTEPIVISATALCTSIRDIVKAKANYKDLYVERLSAIVANVGLISKGGMGDVSSGTNMWALSDLPPAETGATETVLGGTFRVGDENEYLHITPYFDDNGNKHFAIELKAGNISLSSGEGTSFNSGTHVYNADRTRRMKLTPDGIEIEIKDSNNNWVKKGKVIIDKENNMIVTNSDTAPDIRVIVENTAKVFPLVTNLKEELNSSLELDGNATFVQVTDNNQPFFTQDSQIAEGDIEFTPSDDYTVEIICNSDKIRLGDYWLHNDGSVPTKDVATNLNQSFGLTDVFKYQE